MMSGRKSDAGMPKRTTLQERVQNYHQSNSAFEEVKEEPHAADNEEDDEDEGTENGGHQPNIIRNVSDESDGDQPVQVPHGFDVEMSDVVNESI